MYRMIISVFFLILFSGPGQAACICLKCALGTHHMFKINSSAMLPGFAPGDCPIAHLYSDGLTSARGQVVAFSNNSQVFISRLIGLPGDQVEMTNGRVILNGTPLERREDGHFALARSTAPNEFDWACTRGDSCDVPLIRETLPDGTSYHILDLRETRLDTTPAYTVPAGHVFVLGDNRDNAADSRLPRPHGAGFVPTDQLIGIFDAD